MEDSYHGLCSSIQVYIVHVLHTMNINCSIAPNWNNGHGSIDQTLVSTPNLKSCRATPPYWKGDPDAYLTSQFLLTASIYVISNRMWYQYRTVIKYVRGRPKNIRG
jgi:hypothetical protein